MEDNELNLEIIQTILSEYHIQTDSVVNGKQAVERMKETPEGTYDMILMDIMMPVMNGLEATENIRGLEREDCRNKLKRVKDVRQKATLFTLFLVEVSAKND